MHAALRLAKYQLNAVQDSASIRVMCKLNKINYFKNLNSNKLLTPRAV